MLADIDTIQWRLWTMNIDLSGLLDVTFDTAASRGIEPKALVDDDYETCWDWADMLRADGVPGVIVPSAGLPGTSNVILFGPRVLSPYLFPPPDPDVDVPTAHAAERSCPPSEVVPLVRWKGELHRAYEAWRAGTPFVFKDPLVPKGF